MSAAKGPAEPVSSACWAHKEEILEAFEAAWQRGERPALQAYLRADETPTDLLVSLVQADLEYRLKAGEPARLEDYLKTCPALAQDPAGMVLLLTWEYRLRREREPGLRPDDYAVRFPQFRDELVWRLAPVQGQVPPAPPPPDGSRGKPDTLPMGPPAPEGTGQDIGSLGLPPARPLAYPALPGYEILSELGRGGMGVVYKARHCQLKRLVALKMILAGAHAGHEELARFRTEAEAVAHLQHPHIVQIHDIGERDGLPYFSLEFVDGGSLAQQLAGTPQEPRRAAELARTLARAMEAAHQKGIIHRDLKPANILLTADGTPKITDFGLAKKLDDAAGQTASGAIMGTPSYMPPEQARGDGKAIAPAADVYALGAILYETLTGRPPFKGATSFDTLEQLRHEEPIPPRRLQPKLPADLETICLKCLRKEPAKRYASAAALADDLQRFLNGQPIQARPVSAWEKTRKWVKRKPTAAALISVSGLAFVLGTVFGILFTLKLQAALKETQEQRDLATEREKEAKRVLEFFQDQVLAAARPENQDGGLGVNTTIKAAVDAAEPKIAGAFHERPLVEASIRNTLGVTYSYLRENQAAIKQFERALELRRHQLEPDHADILTSMNDLAMAYQDAGQLDKALALLEQLLVKGQEKFGPDHPETLICMDNLAQVYQETGQLDKALSLLEEALPKFQETLGPRDPHTLTCMAALALAYKAAGQLDKAVPLSKQTLAGRQETLGPDHPETLTSMNNLALAYLAADQLDKALELFERTLALRKEKLGPNHPHTLSTMNNLASAYRYAGKFEKAVPLYEQTLAKKKDKLGPDHPRTLICMDNLAQAYLLSGQLEKALPLLEETLAKFQEKCGPDHPDTLTCMNNLARAYQADGRTAEAIALFEQVRDAKVKKLGADHPKTLTTMNNLAGAYLADGRTAEAVALFERVRDLLVQKLGAEHRETLGAVNNLAVAYQAAGRMAEAIALFEQVRDAQVKKRGADHPSALATQANLARAYLAAGKPEQALPLFQQAANGIEKHRFRLEGAGTNIGSLIACQEQLKQYDQAETWRKKWLAVVKERDGPQSSAYAGKLTGLGWNLLLQQKHAEAETTLRECLALRTKQDPEAWTTFNTQSLLGGALLGQQRYADAEPLLQAGYEGLKQREAKIPPAAKVRLTEALERLVQLYDAWGKPDQAAAWRTTLDQAKPPKKESRK